MSDSSNQAKAKILTIGGLETVYDALATAILFQQQIEAALMDL